AGRVVATAPDPIAPAGPPPIRRRSRTVEAALSAGLAILGMAAVIGLWAGVAAVRPDLPAPADAIAQLKTMLASPFHDGGPNDKGIFLQLSLSLGKVFAGFAFAALVGIPLGFAIGGVGSLRKAINPVVQILRPVSPLAWFPIALVLFKDGVKASMFTIAITALWPMLINTAVGAAGIPRDHRNVARIFKFSKRKYLRHVLIPYSMTSVLTGMRLSMGIAWMVIVATEMLSGGGGVGFFVWDSYNNNNLPAVVSAIVLIGLIGFALDLGFSRLASRFDYSKEAC
ncbi:MAG: nitrate ABC transporter permease, partial [Actinomycetota bacterium]